MRSELLLNPSALLPLLASNSISLLLKLLSKPHVFQAEKIGTVWQRCTDNPGTTLRHLICSNDMELFGMSGELAIADAI